jgi:hypothetical protein
VLLMTAAIVAGCSSSSPTAKGGPAPAPVGAVGAAASTLPRGPTTPGHTATPSSGAVNLAVTETVRTELVRAGAALHELPMSDYAGLRPGMTYYARDLATGNDWAAAGLQPDPGSYDAGVANQDRGAYMVFTRSPGGAWHGWETGLTGGPAGPCPVTVPPSVLSVWGWPPGTCYPPNGGRDDRALARADGAARGRGEVMTTLGELEARFGGASST